jgi:hypothetical protein
LVTSTPAARGADAEPAGALAPDAGEDAAEAAVPGPVALISVGPEGRPWYHQAAPEAAAIPTTATTR